MRHGWLGRWIQGIPLLRKQFGAVAWEYMLIIGVVSVAIVGAIAGPTTGFVTVFVTGVCGALASILPSISC